MAFHFGYRSRSFAKQIHFMNRHSQRVRFDNGRGQLLAGILDLPESEPAFYAVFSHCFTCTKDIKATVHISRHLTQYGIGTLRYDFTGLGDSQGKFSDTNFSTNCQDLLAACRFLGEQYSPPRLLIGHSLGGTATVTTANDVGSAQAVVTIASPSSTRHLAGFLEKTNPEIDRQGEGDVVIGGRTFRLKKQLLDSLRSHNIETTTAELKKPILMFHSPADMTVPYEWGLRMFELALSPKAFITLDGADHLLINQSGDVPFVADSIGHWVGRYVSTQ